MKKIYMLFATIRPKMFRETYEHWINTAKNKDNIITKVAVTSEEQKEELSDFDVIVVNDKKGYNHASCVLLKSIDVNDDDIIILPSDDFYSPQDWDEFLLNQFENYDGCMFLNDGYQNPDIKEGMLSITIACMTFATVKKLNRSLFSSAYRHFFSDTELYATLKELNLLKDDRDKYKDVIFEHKHHVLGKRKQDEHDINNMSNWDVDHKTFQDRMAMKVEDRLK